MVKIESGKVFKNYKVVCEYLNEKVKTGSSKQAQLKDWSRRFKFHKEGHKIIIDEVYSTLKEKKDNRKYNNFKKGTRYVSKSYYKPYLKKIILSELTKTSNGEFVGSLTKLLGNAEIITNKIHNCYEDNVIDTYLEVLGSKLRRCFKSCLEELKQEGLISYEKVSLIKLGSNDYEDLIFLEDDLRKQGKFNKRKTLYEESKRYAEKEMGLSFHQCVRNVKRFSSFKEYQKEFLQQFFGKKVSDVREVFNITLLKDINTVEKMSQVTLDEKLRLITNLHKRTLVSKPFQTAKTLFLEGKQGTDKDFIELCQSASSTFYKGVNSDVQLEINDNLLRNKVRVFNKSVKKKGEKKNDGTKR